MNTTSRVFVGLMLVFALVLVVGLGCSTTTPVAKSTCAPDMLVSSGNHTMPISSFAAGDSLGMKLIANHPVLVAQRTKAFNVAHNRAIISY